MSWCPWDMRSGMPWCEAILPMGMRSGMPCEAILPRDMRSGMPLWEVVWDCVKQLSLGT